MASAISPAFAAASITCNGSAWTRSGFRRSIRRRWRTSATTSAITRDIDPIFGTLDDFDALLAEAHARGLKVLLDYVPNHTSDQHPWFVESRARRATTQSATGTSGAIPRRTADRPTTGSANFGGRAWEWDEATGQYYYHAFLKEQPDLNWRNPEVREAMLDVLRFWLDRGVDGFRVDVICVI